MDSFLLKDCYFLKDYDINYNNEFEFSLSPSENILSILCNTIYTFINNQKSTKNFDIIYNNILFHITTYFQKEYVSITPSHDAIFWHKCFDWTNKDNIPISKGYNLIIISIFRNKILAFLPSHLYAIEFSIFLYNEHMVDFALSFYKNFITYKFNYIIKLDPNITDISPIFDIYNKYIKSFDNISIVRSNNYNYNIDLDYLLINPDIQLEYPSSCIYIYIYVIYNIFIDNDYSSCI